MSVGCSLDETTFRVVPSNSPGGVCLLTDQRYGRRFLHQILRGPISLAHCKLICAKLPGCLSFDYYVGRDRADTLAPVCVLSRVDPATLKRRLSDPVSFGANPMELKMHSAARCFLFRKICKKCKCHAETELGRAKAIEIKQFR